MPTPAKIKFYYDPRGEVIRTVNPDGSEQRVIIGKPNNVGSIPVWGENDISNSPWETTTYDANDLGGGAGFNTPKTAIKDALGRTVKTIDRLNTDTSGEVVMKYQYDIRGNLLNVTDALNRKAFAHTYDLRPKEKGEDEKEKPAQPIKSLHIDKGENIILSDATGKPVEANDAKGARVLSSYDVINRPQNVWAKDNTGGSETLRHHTIYGDNATYGPTSPSATNHLGKPYKVFDESGLDTVTEYDFKGNVLQKTKEVLDDSLLSGDTAFAVDWEASPTLAPDVYQTDTEFDALNRPIKITYPEDVNSNRKELVPDYNRAGALEKVSFDGTDYVKHIAYNAKGQRLLIAFGNNVMTRYAYDTRTFRLMRQRSETYSKSGWVFSSGGSVKQDTGYEYDLSGNILKTKEQTTGCGVGNTDSLDRNFNYDALYRLLKATGRENSPTISPIWDDSYRSNNSSTSTAYTQNYVYDKMGNIQSLQHIGYSNFTRQFNYGPNITRNVSGNRLNHIDVGIDYEYSYDNCGNQLTETNSRFFEWGVTDELKFFKVDDGTTISQKAHYLYSGGKRVKKFWTNGVGDTETTVYIDGIFEHRYNSSGDSQSLHHIMDAKSRIASVRVGDTMGDSSGEDPMDSTIAIKYILEDHLGSSTMELKNDGAMIEKEEYYPFGETSFASYQQKRYKYCGKERDGESGLFYYGARYYSAWTCRFVSVDPKSSNFPSQSSFCYANNNPVRMNDPNGMEAEDTAGGSSSSNIGCEQISIEAAQSSTQGDITTYNFESTTISSEGNKISIDKVSLEYSYNNKTSETIGLNRNETKISVSNNLLRGGVVNSAREIFQIGKDLTIRLNEYIKPYNSAKAVYEANSTFENRLQAVLGRQTDLGVVREKIGPVGKASSELMKPMQESLKKSYSVLTSDQPLSNTRKGVDAVVPFRNWFKVAGLLTIAVSVKISIEKIINSGGDLNVVINELGGHAGAYMVGAMGAELGFMLGVSFPILGVATPLIGALVGGFGGAMLGWYLGSGDYAK